MKLLQRRVFAFCVLITFCSSLSAKSPHWFEQVKATATDQELLQLLTALPKGGDLHNHITGAVHSEWFWDLALAAPAHGYEYFVKVRINNCKFDSNEHGPGAYLLLFRNINKFQYEKLSDCEQQEYIPIAQLSGEQRQQWLESMRLDKPHEGREEFFEAHWPRINAFVTNPYLVADLLVRNMQAFGEEGLLYLEAQITVHGMRNPDGSLIDPDTVAEIYRQRLLQRDAIATGVTVRFQLAILRFVPQAEAFLDIVYRFVAANEDFVGVNMVGREDNDKGYPLRFLSTLRKLRNEVGDVPLSFHAGEVDEPNFHIRDTLLLGADRIGHGVNLIQDPETMRQMRHGPYLVEVNLISNLLLEYVSTYQDHPFPEYLRTDIPVALSTDDRGMWDSTLTDEFFVAVREFNLSWAEIRKLSNNSIAYAFLPPEQKQRLLSKLNNKLDAFERKAAKQGVKGFASVTPQYRGFLCRQYKVCAPDAN